MSTEEYGNLLKERVKENYTKISRIYCGCVKEYVFFNAQGFNHLLYRFSGKPREINEQVYKLQLFKFVPGVVRSTVSIDEVRYEIGAASRKKNASMKKITYIAIIGPSKIKVILKKVGNGNFTFWSVMRLRD